MFATFAAIRKLIVPSVFTLIFFSLDTTSYFERAVIFCQFSIYIHYLKDATEFRNQIGIVLILKHLISQNGLDQTLSTETRHIAKCLQSEGLINEAMSTNPASITQEEVGLGISDIINKILWLLLAVILGLSYTI